MLDEFRQLADLGEPPGRDAGFAPLTSTIRGYRSEVTLEPDVDNGLEAVSAAQCQHIRAIAIERLAAPVGNIGPQALAQTRESLANPPDL